MFFSLKIKYPDLLIIILMIHVWNYTIHYILLDPSNYIDLIAIIKQMRDGIYIINNIKILDEFIKKCMNDYVNDIYFGLN